MSEKLEKIGGYVVNGQPQLAHDNTLKGTGLPYSPLGLNNETVLWEGTLSSSSDVITLSEKLDNFDTYYVIMKTWNNITEITYSTCNYGYKKLKAKVIWPEGEKIIMSVISYTTTDYLNFNFERLVVRRITSSGIEYVTTSWDEYNVITKVVGINRKST